MVENIWHKNRLKLVLPAHGLFTVSTRSVHDKHPINNLHIHQRSHRDPHGMFSGSYCLFIVCVNNPLGGKQYVLVFVTVFTNTYLALARFSRSRVTWMQCNNGARILQSRGAPGVAETSQSLWLLVPVLEAGQQGWESRRGRALITCRGICNLWALCNLLIYLFTVFFSIFALNNSRNIFLNDKNVRNIYFLIWLY